MLFGSDADRERDFWHISNPDFWFSSRQWSNHIIRRSRVFLLEEHPGSHTNTKRTTLDHGRGQWSNHIIPSQEQSERLLWS